MVTTIKAVKVELSDAARVAKAAADAAEDMAISVWLSNVTMNNRRNRRSY